MIQVLPSNIANMIAAGEVVGRPASVVKELMENSVDAGAQTITVSISDAGRTSIEVVDDGCGMSPEDASICFERHATSKILSQEDLERILTFGFRGEALASIAAVAHVEMLTKTEEQDVGVRVQATASDINITPAASQKGTKIVVSDLFYNIPARRKFLKSDAAEMRHIVEEFSRVALTRPNISFSLWHNGNLVHQLRAVSNHKQRISDLCGKHITKELVEVKTDTSIVKIAGYVGDPQCAKKSQSNQYLFVNGRFFKSGYIHKAITNAYENLVKDGYSPSYFIYLEVNPAAIDINIHPQKTEIKFEDDSSLFQIVSAGVREALGRNSFGGSIDFDSGELIDFPVMGSSTFSSASGDRYYQAPPKIDYNPLFNPFDNNRSEERVIRDYATEIGDLGGKEIGFGGRDAIVVQNRYIITPTNEGIVVVDIKMAKERIFYEKYLPLIVERQPVTQQSLFPINIELSVNQHSILMEYLDSILALGFDIKDFGGNSVVVYGVPDGFNSSEDSVKESIDSIIASLEDGSFLDDVASQKAIALAKAAVRGGYGRVDRIAAIGILETLSQCRDARYGIDGSSCMWNIGIEELTKRL